MSKLINLFIIIFTIFANCNFTGPEIRGAEESIETKIEKTEAQILAEAGENEFEERRNEILGVWSLDRVVLRSKMYSDDISKNGDIIPVDVEDYLGCKIEYSEQNLRLAGKTYFKPQYSLTYVTPAEYEMGGHFRLTAGYPSFEEFIETEKIEVDGADEYGYFGNVPLKRFDISFDEKYHVPLGQECVMLNKDTILIGTWGKIILAHRVDEEGGTFERKNTGLFSPYKTDYGYKLWYGTWAVEKKVGGNEEPTSQNISDTIGKTYTFFRGEAEFYYNEQEIYIEYPEYRTVIIPLDKQTTYIPHMKSTLAEIGITGKYVVIFSIPKYDMYFFLKDEETLIMYYKETYMELRRIKQKNRNMSNYSAS